MSNRKKKKLLKKQLEKECDEILRQAIRKQVRKEWISYFGHNYTKRLITT